MLSDELSECEFVRFLDEDEDVGMCEYLIEFWDIYVKIVRLYFPIDGQLWVYSVDMAERNLLDVHKEVSCALDS